MGVKVARMVGEELALSESQTNKSLRNRPIQSADKYK
jgi:hypothetical protein